VADPASVATKRAIADVRMRKAADRLAREVGVEFVPPSTPANRFPDLYTAELVERVADFLERLGGNVSRPQEKRR
jgi:hypothetical protein